MPVSDPTVKIIVQGLVALFFERQGDQITNCKFGILKDAPGHILNLKFQKLTGGGGTPQPVPIPPVSGDAVLQLAVENEPTSISFVGPDAHVDRRTGKGDPHSFRW